MKYLISQSIVGLYDKKIRSILDVHQTKTSTYLILEKMYIREFASHLYYIHWINIFNEWLELIVLQSNAKLEKYRNQEIFENCLTT